MGVFLDLSLTAGHGGSFKVVLKRKKMCSGQATAVPYHDRQCGFGVGQADKCDFLLEAELYRISAVRSKFEQNNLSIAESFWVAALY
jgi:hypothetical protein